MNALDNVYARFLKWSVNHRKTILFGALGIFISSLFLIKVIPSQFFPTQDQARLSIKVKLPVGTRLETSRAFGLKLTEKIKKDYPEVRMCNFSVGQPDEDNAWGMMGDNGNHVISFNIRLLKKTERKRSITEIADQMRSDLSKYPEINTYMINAGGGGMGGQSSVDVEIYGYDFDVSDKFAADLSKELRKIKGCSEVNISRNEYTPEIQIDFDRQKLAENGLNITTAATFVRNRFTGSLASFYREEGDEYNIRVRYAPEFRQSVEAIENILIYNNQGIGIRVKDLATVVERLTPPSIERKDRERMIKVSAIVGKDAVLSEVVQETQKTLDKLDIPTGMSYKIGGEWEEQQELWRYILFNGIDSGAGIYCYGLSIESFTYPL